MSVTNTPLPPKKKKKNQSQPSICANDQKDLSTSTHAIAWKPSCLQMDDNHQDDIDNTKPKPKYHGNICFYKNS